MGASTSQGARYWTGADVTKVPGHEDDAPRLVEAGLLPRPEPLHDPGHRAHKAELATALFGAATEVIKVSRFRVLERLGEGGMGVVYAGEDEELGRAIAIKLLHAELGEGRDARTRLLREAQALARLSHPNVVQIFEVGEHQGRLFVAMELVRGETVHAWIHGPAPRPWQEVLRIFLAAGHGLAAAHAVGLVHRDFKPSNVMIGEDGRVRVLDFGLARALGEHGSTSPTTARGTTRDDSLTTPLTLTGGVLGTPAYMAPEQQGGQPCDARADQFSFCVALYEALHGVRPFAGGHPEEVAAAIARRDLQRPPASSRVPAWLHAAVVRGLAPEPADRWPSMPALLHELARDRDGERRRRRFGAAFAALGLVGLIAGGITGARALAQHRLATTCAAQADELHETWNPLVLARVVAARAPRTTAGTADDLEDVLFSIRRAADRWQEMRTEHCMSPLPTVTRMPDVAAKLDACFLSAHDDLRTLIEVTASAPSLHAANPAVMNIDLDCTSRARLLSGEPSYPRDPAVRAQIQDVRGAIIRADLERVSGDIGAAEARMQAATTAARALPFARDLLHSLRELATAQFAAGHRQRAWASFEEALELSARVTDSALTDDFSATDLQLLLGGASGTSREAIARLLSPPVRPTAGNLLAALRGPDGPRDTAWADIFKRGGWITERALHRTSIAAHVWLGLAEHEVAERFARRSLEHVAVLPIHDDPLESNLLLALGQAQLGLGLLDRADTTLRQARVVGERASGLSPARVGFVHLALSDVHRAQGDLDGAARALDAAAQLAPQAAIDDDRYQPTLDLARGRLLVAREDLTAAEAAFTAARRALTASHGAARSLLVACHRELAGLALADGRLDVVDEHVHEALRIGAEMTGTDHASQVPALLLLARLQRTRDYLAPAQETLERALVLVEAHTTALHLRGEVRAELARVLEQRAADPTRIAGLIAAARDDYAASPVHSPERPALEAWLRAAAQPGSSTNG